MCRGPNRSVGAVEASSKIFDCAEVVACGMLPVITLLEFLQHHFSEMGHKDLLVTQNLSQPQAINARSPHAKRPPHERLRSNAVSLRVEERPVRCRSSLAVSAVSSFVLTP